MTKLCLDEDFHAYILLLGDYVIPEICFSTGIVRKHAETLIEGTNGVISLLSGS